MCKHEKTLIKDIQNRTFHICKNPQCGYLWLWIEAEKYITKNNLDFNLNSLEEVN